MLQNSQNLKQVKKIPKIVDLDILIVLCAYSNSETEFCFDVRPQRNKNIKWKGGK